VKNALLRRAYACGSHRALSDAAVSPDWFVETSWQREIAEIAGSGVTFDNSFCRERDLQPTVSATSPGGLRSPHPAAG
jgi:hypothetical protein